MTDTFVEILPTSMDLLYREAPRPPHPLARGLSERIVQTLARQVVTGPARGDVRFSVVDSARKWEQIRRLRLDTYTGPLEYMRNVVNEDGVDLYDARSVVFGAWVGDEAVATVRLTAWPFEMATLLPAGRLSALVPEERRHDTLEFTRLISSKREGLSRVMPALIMYSGISLAANTGCRHYIGYTKTTVSRLFNKFMCDDGAEPFTIPSRGEHQYRILQGEFRKDIHNIIDARLRVPLVRPLLKALV